MGYSYTLILGLDNDVLIFSIFFCIDSLFNKLLNSNTVSHILVIMCVTFFQIMPNKVDVPEPQKGLKPLILMMDMIVQWIDTHGL